MNLYLRRALALQLDTEFGHSVYPGWVRFLQIAACTALVATWELMTRRRDTLVPLKAGVSVLALIPVNHSPLPAQTMVSFLTTVVTFVEGGYVCYCLLGCFSVNRTINKCCLSWP